MSDASFRRELVMRVYSRQLQLHALTTGVIVLVLMEEKCLSLDRLLIEALWRFLVGCELSKFRWSSS